MTRADSLLKQLREDFPSNEWKIEIINNINSFIHINNNRKIKITFTSPLVEDIFPDQPYSYSEFSELLKSIIVV